MLLSSFIFLVTLNEIVYFETGGNSGLLLLHAVRLSLKYFVHFSGHSVQGGCCPAGHLSGEGKIIVSEDYSGLRIMPSEEMLRKPWYIKNNQRKGRLRRTLRAVFKF